MRIARAETPSMIDDASHVSRRTAICPIIHFKLNEAYPLIRHPASHCNRLPIDYQNTFNLALYHLAAAHPEASDRLYTSNLTAPIEWLQMAIDDLDDFLHLFPDHSQAQQVKQLLQGAIQS
jgi:hypothetical protein